MKENIFADLIPKLRNALLSDPVTRPAVIKWASEPDGSIEQSERSSMLEEMFGPDFGGRYRSR